MSKGEKALLAALAGGTLALAAVAALWVGTAGDGRGSSGGGTLSYGENLLVRGRTSMEEHILYSDVIARVSLEKVAQATEPLSLGALAGGRAAYTGVLEFTLEVHEYLKGSGPTELVAVAHDPRWGFYLPGGGGITDFAETAGDLEDALGDYLLEARDASWDDREAIVFLRASDPELPSTARAGRYWLGYTHHAVATNGYLVTARWHRAWLPEQASGGGSTAGAAAAQEQTFLLDVLGDAPPAAQAEAKAEMAGRPGWAGDAGDYVITVASLKARIAELEAEASGGHGSQAYRDCIEAKYTEERKLGWEQETGLDYQVIEAVESASGEPPGTRVYRGIAAEWRLQEHGSIPSQEVLHQLDQEYHTQLLGPDAALFTIRYPYDVYPARPLPAGEYAFFTDSHLRLLDICDGWPVEKQREFGAELTVTAPAGTVHEAFFDAAAVGVDAVGADALFGVLEPARFTPAGGTAVTLERIAWQDNRAWVEFAAAPALAGHHLDVIDLEGEVSLRLDLDDAAAATTAGGAHALSWGVCGQPWEAGDLLMLRLSTSGDTLTGATNDTACDGTAIDTATAPEITSLPCADGTAVPDPQDNRGLVHDCRVLLGAKGALLGTAKDLLEWSAEKPIKEWRGVRLAGTPQRVTEVHAAYKGLGGVVPPELGELSGLIKVDLRGNKLTGGIPAELGNLTHLEYLNLSGNDLTGAIPAELAELSVLERLYLNGNKLTGDIPPELWKLRALTHVYYRGNALTGCVPAAWEDIAKSDAPATVGLAYCGSG